MVAGESIPGRKLGGVRDRDCRDRPVGRSVEVRGSGRRDGFRWSSPVLSPTLGRFPQYEHQAYVGVDRGGSFRAGSGRSSRCPPGRFAAHTLADRHPVVRGVPGAPWLLPGPTGTNTRSAATGAGPSVGDCSAVGCWNRRSIPTRIRLLNCGVLLARWRFVLHLARAAAPLPTAAFPPGIRHRRRESRRQGIAEPNWRRLTLSPFRPSEPIAVTATGGGPPDAVGRGHCTPSIGKTGDAIIGRINGVKCRSAGPLGRAARDRPTPVRGNRHRPDR